MAARPLPKQSNYWMFTINNPTDEDDPSLWQGFQFLAYQREVCPTTNTPHYQGYVVFPKKIRLTGLKKINSRAHWQARLGTHEQALAYVTKDSTRAPDSEPIIIGDPPLPTEQGKRNDLIKLQEDLNAGHDLVKISQDHFPLFLKYPRAIEKYLFIRQPKRNFRTMVTISYGLPGTGKSRDLYQLYPDAYYKNKGKWWDGYNGEEHVIIDDFYGWIPFSDMLRLLDRYPLTLPTKGSHVQFRSKYVHFTSNRPWEKWWKCLERNQTWQNAFDRRVDLILRYTELDSPPIIEKCSEEGDELQYIFVPNLSTPFTSPVPTPSLLSSTYS